MKSYLMALLVLGGSAVAISPAPAQDLKQRATINSDEQLLCLAFSPDGKLLATGDANLTVKLWDVTNGKEKRTLIKAKTPRTVTDEKLGTVVRDTEGFSSLAFSPDGKLLAAVSNKAKLRVWDVGTGEMRTEVRAHNGGVFGVAFSPDGKLLATGGAASAFIPVDQVRGQVKLWDAATLKEKTALKPDQTQFVLCVAFSSDGKLLAAGTQNDGFKDHSMIKLWDVATGKEHATLKGKGEYEIVHSVAFSSDGNLLAAGSGSVTGNGTLRLWDLETGKERTVLQGHSDQLRSVAFSPDAKWLASVGSDSSVRLWDVATAKQSAIKKIYLGGFSVAFSPDGKLLAATEYKVVTLWDVPAKPNAK